VVLQVESDITVLLDGAEDLKAMDVRFDILQTDYSASMAYLDSLSSNLLFRESVSHVELSRAGGVHGGGIGETHTSGPQWSPPKTTTLKEGISRV